VFMMNSNICFTDFFSFDFVHESEIAFKLSIKQMESYLNEMQASSISPNEVTFTNLLDGYVRAGDFNSGWKVLEDMKVKGMKWTVNACSRFISPFKEENVPLKSRGLFEDLKSRFTQPTRNRSDAISIEEMELLGQFMDKMK